MPRSVRALRQLPPVGTSFAGPGSTTTRAGRPPTWGLQHRRRHRHRCRCPRSPARTSRWRSARCNQPIRPGARRWTRTSAVTAGGSWWASNACPDRGSPSSEEDENMNDMRRTLAVFVLLGLGGTVAMAGPKVQVQRDPEFDFATLKTWTWNPSGPGELKVIVSADSKSEPVKQTYEPVIMKAVEEELTKRGLAQASGAQPDFNVTYYLLITAGSSSQEMGQFLPAVTYYGVPPFAPQTTSLSIYPKGTLVLDVATPEPRHVVWRAVTQAKIELDNTEAQRTARLRDVVRDVLAKLPRK